MDTFNFNSPAVYLNQNVRGLKPSATLRINELSAKLQAEGRRIFRLGLGQSPFPVPSTMVQALQTHADEKDYLPVRGLPALREAVADFYQRTEGLNYNPENIIVGPGTKELMFILQLTYYGELIIPTPSWVSYAPQAEICGRRLCWIPTDPASNLRMDAGTLERICEEDPDRPRLLILNYPGNPTGFSYSADQLESIAEVARKYRVLVLSDEIYSGLNFEGTHTSIARYYPEGTIISNGISKWAGAGGWRMGAFAFPENLSWLLDSMTVVASETFTSISAPIQYAAIKAFEDSPEMDSYLSGMQRILRQLLYTGADKLRNTGATVPEPSGGFYLFPNFESHREALAKRGITTSDQLCNALLNETGVATLPGTEFGRPREELSLRMALVDFDGGQPLEAAAYADVIEQHFLEAHCPNVMEALGLICGWIGEAG